MRIRACGPPHRFILRHATTSQGPKWRETAWGSDVPDGVARHFSTCHDAAWESPLPSASPTPPSHPEFACHAAGRQRPVASVSFFSLQVYRRLQGRRQGVGSLSSGTRAPRKTGKQNARPCGGLWHKLPAHQMHLHPSCCRLPAVRLCTGCPAPAGPHLPPTSQSTFRGCLGHGPFVQQALKLPLMGEFPTIALSCTASNVFFHGLLLLVWCASAWSH